MRELTLNARAASMQPRVGVLTLMWSSIGR